MTPRFYRSTDTKETPRPFDGPLYTRLVRDSLITELKTQYPLAEIVTYNYYVQDSQKTEVDGTVLFDWDSKGKEWNLYLDHNVFGNNDAVKVGAKNELGIADQT